MLYNNQNKPVTLTAEEEQTCRKARQLQEYLEKNEGKEPTAEMRKVMSKRVILLHNLREMLIPTNRRDNFFRLDQRARITG
jgi:hypothetical protein